MHQSNEPQHSPALDHKIGMFNNSIVIPIKESGGMKISDNQKQADFKNTLFFLDKNSHEKQKTKGNKMDHLPSI